MFMARVVALWLNYNSSRLWDIARESLHSVLNLERGDFSLTILVVDGGSTDNSPDLINKYISNIGFKNEVVLYRLSENRGYAGNLNSGYEYAVNNLGADYVVFLNNDFIVRSDSLRRLFEWIKRGDYVGIQGLELRPDGVIGNAGVFHDEFGQVLAACRGYKIEDCDLTKPHYVTFTMGGYTIYSVDFINELPDKLPFITDTFMYFDDNYIGLMAWQKSRKVAFVPVIAGIHHGGTTSKSLYGVKSNSVNLYLMIKAKTALWENMHCRYHNLFKLYKSRLYLMAKLHLLDESIRRGIFDGIKLAKIVREKAGIIDMEKATHVEFSRTLYLIRATVPGFGSIATHDSHIKYLSKHIRYPDKL
jgi:glycosyltransferase involved in cell wall biosynthesis